MNIEQQCYWNRSSRRHFHILLVPATLRFPRLTLGVGRAKLADALAQLYRDVRGQGLSLAELAKKTANSHSTEEDHARALTDLTQTMDDLSHFAEPHPPRKASREKVSSAWARLQSLVHGIPEPEELADYCRRVEGFRKLRPSAAGNIKSARHVVG